MGAKGKKFGLSFRSGDRTFSFDVHPPPRGPDLAYLLGAELDPDRVSIDPPKHWVKVLFSASSRPSGSGSASLGSVPPTGVVLIAVAVAVGRSYRNAIVGADPRKEWSHDHPAPHLSRHRLEHGGGPRGESVGGVGGGAVQEGTYRGKTSQNRGVVLKMSRRSVRRLSEVETELRTQCGGTPAKLTLFAFPFDARVSPSGRFGAPRWSPIPRSTPLDDRERRRLVDVTRFEFSGRFVTRRRVRGHWRARSVLLDQTEAFESNGGVFDRCDTGDVTWSARLRRR